ncbi:hypothetical protein CS0771_45130 [Catellatospora sp. IY07-71]|uniref:HAD family hydrolase n=1 Tax=Catellatospora sp. IY07-71 TaxID=2728827 RepID=UPI001BB415E8|nr:HAD family hydrolase [Catellatospora sp. IY07-71]BCJ74969.1 hypothetical protein CS0771_45130 [Catellatospora sp. IY07-71]
MPESGATTSYDASSVIPRLLARAQALLLAVDGPLCALTPRLTSLGSAERMRELLTALDYHVPDELADVADPYAVMRYAGTIADPRLWCDIEDVLSRLEDAAMIQATPTAGAHETIRAARAAAKGVALVSDQAAWTIERYMAIHGLAEEANAVGRWTVTPKRWMPDPYPLHHGASIVRARRPSAALFIGATSLDARTAAAARMPFLGIADLRASAEDLREAGAEHVLGPEAMLLLAAALRGPTANL